MKLKDRLTATVGSRPSKGVDIRRVTIANGLATDAPGFPPAFGFGFGGGLYRIKFAKGLNGTIAVASLLKNRRPSGILEGVHGVLA